MQNPSSSPALPPTRWPVPHRAAAGAAIVAAIVIAYFPAVRGGFLWDDDAHVTRPELRSAHGLYRIWFDVGATQQYYPVVYSAFWLEHQLWGDSTIGYHVVNIALHACATVLVLLLMRRLLMDQAVPWAETGALLTAAVFALHPVQVESVAWISEQKNTISALFYLTAMLAYLGFDRSRRRPLYALASLLFVLSLLSKPVTVTLPATLLVVLWWQRGMLTWRRDVLPLSPWFALSVASGLFAAWVEHAVIGAQGSAFALAGLQHLLLPGRAVWFYLSKLFWPTELLFIYPRFPLDPAVWWQWLFPLALLALLVVLAALARRWRAPLAALLFFIGSLFPVLGFFNVFLFLYTYVADHFQYLPSLGVIALACGVAAAGAARIPWRAARGVLLLGLPAVLAVLTFRQARMYTDIRTLYEATLQRNPTCWMVHNNLGKVLQDEGHMRAALDHYHRALQIRPDFPEALNNLAAIWIAVGRCDEAIASCQQALRLRPNYSDALGNLVVAFTNTGRLQEAIESARQALHIRSDDARMHFNLGVALVMAGRHRESVDEFVEAIRLQPDFAEAHLNLAVACYAIDRVPEALAAAQRARELARAAGRQALVAQVDASMESCRTRATSSPASP